MQSHVTQVVTQQSISSFGPQRYRAHALLTSASRLQLHHGSVGAAQVCRKRGLSHPGIIGAAACRRQHGVAHTPNSTMPAAACRKAGVATCCQAKQMPQACHLL